MKEYAKQFYKSAAWEYTRKAYAESVDGLCERCLKNGKYVPGKIVHHKTHLTPANINVPEIALGWGNLELLCQDCHNKEHHAQQYDVRYRFDSNGNLLVLEDTD